MCLKLTWSKKIAIFIFGSHDLKLPEMENWNGKRIIQESNISNINFALFLQLIIFLALRQRAQGKSHWASKI